MDPAGNPLPQQLQAARTGARLPGAEPAADPRPDTRRVTIREVAALAGVSIGTASKALNGQGRLRPETRERVTAAARELGFAPNVLAR
ncbi:MAG: LacI family DNA-binding transcriptional regulator, partial [Nocardiopsaceae bacterium]|nr:LacI family DNA-binding transcriptional regulator [Nocardiopsaceae bacterium]